MSDQQENAVLILSRVLCLLYFSLTLVACQATDDQSIQVNSSPESTATAFSTSIAVLAEPTEPAILKPSQTATQTASPTKRATATELNWTVAPPREEPVCPEVRYDSELPHPDEPEGYDGLSFDTRNLPEELSFWKGAVLFDDLDDEIEFGLVLVVRIEEDLPMLWFEKLLCRDEDGKAHWQIIDALNLPPISEGQEFTMWYCRYGEDGPFDPEIVAIGFVQAGALEFFSIEFAWQLNRVTESIEPITTDGLVCLRNI